MKKVLNLLLSIPALAVYFYGATILTEYGFASYFHIPYSFISASLSDNIIYFFQLLTVVEAILGYMRWQMWLLVFVIVLTIVYLCYRHRFWRVLFGVVGMIILLVILLGSFNFGKTIAASTADFWVLPPGCLAAGLDGRYVIPAFYGENAVLIHIDQNNKMTGGFLVKNITSLACEVEREAIGTVAD